MAKTFTRLAAANRDGKYLCVGIDPDPDHVATIAGRGAMSGEIMLDYGYRLFCATKKHAAMYKTQLACWARYPRELRDLHSEITSESKHPKILDGKFNEIGNSAAYWAEFAEYVRADAVTMTSYMGLDDVADEFLNRGIDVFVVTSSTNIGSGFLQKQQLDGGDYVNSYVAHEVNERIRNGKSLGITAASTDPIALSAMLDAAPLAPVLGPGIGAQGGDAAAVITHLKSHKAPWALSVSRDIAESVLTPSDWHAWARGVADASARYASEFRTLAAQ